jgi:hypothetical protein
MLEAMFIASLRTLALDEIEESASREPGESRGVIDLAWEHGQLHDAALESQADFQAALEQLLARVGHQALVSEGLTLTQRRVRQLETIGRFEAWATDELAGRTEKSRAEAPKLNRLLSNWFSTITVVVGRVHVEITAHRRFPGEQPSSQSLVHFDRADWTRVACHVGRPRLRCAQWDDAEILGAMLAWSEANRRSPTRSDWIKAKPNQPSSLTVERHFKYWDRALRAAGLKPYVPDSLPRNYAWGDPDVIQALQTWATEHDGRPPAWHEWLRAAPGRPCTDTVVQHFGTWRSGLAAANLWVPDRDILPGRPASRP